MTNTYSQKISIVMASYNRKLQTIQTLDQFEKLYAGKYNIEVIIVDDSSDSMNQINKTELDEYTYKIIIIQLKEKNWINPVIPYNIGFSHVSPGTNYVIIQNPEIFHCDDIIKHMLDNLADNQYFTYPVFLSPSMSHNQLVTNITENQYYDEFVKKINYNDFDFDYAYYLSNYKDLQHLNINKAHAHYLSNGIREKRQCNKNNIFYRKDMIKSKGWYNHVKLNPRNLHFLSALKYDVLKKIGGFDTRMKDGLWYDDNDFLNRIQKIANVKLIDSNVYFGIHLYHTGGSENHMQVNNFKALTQKNLGILQNNKVNKIIYVDPGNFDNIKKEYIYKNPTSWSNYMIRSRVKYVNESDLINHSDVNLMHHIL